MAAFSLILLLTLFTFALAAPAEEYGPCFLTPELKKTASKWDGKFAGLNYCGRLVIQQQNCYNCMSPNPLTDRSCICDKETFRLDVIGAMVGSYPNCKGQPEKFLKYRELFCSGKLPAPKESPKIAVAKKTPVKKAKKAPVKKAKKVVKKKVSPKSSQSIKKNGKKVN
ncbi:hypothetical protein HK098_006642 [Nowakowskiella sp. JEL0407]|nr:hypothetical protein HK098_006642 [Nowakowskiella sp. JEL0407]